MSETNAGAAVELSQAVVQLPYFLDEALQAQALEDPQRLAPETIGDRRLVHIAALRLVATERRRERERAWDAYRQSLSENDTPPSRVSWMQGWQQDWQFTEERRQRVMEQHPLAVRKAGRQLMRIINQERLDDRGQPLDPDSVTMIPADVILPAPDLEARMLALQLRRAGYNRTLDTTVHRFRRSGLAYPADAVRYLETFPPPEPRREGEYTFNDAVTLLRTSTSHLADIIEQNDIFPVVRLDSSISRQEQEFYTPEAIDQIRIIVEQTPYKTDEETFAGALIGERGRDLFERALADLGIEAPYRRLPGERTRRCVTNTDRDRINSYIEYLTTQQPGEMDARELAAALGVSRTRVYGAVRPDEWALARSLYAQPGEVHEGRQRRMRRLLPPAVVAKIIERNRSQYLPPDLITESGIARYLAHMPSAPRRYLADLTKNGNNPIVMRLAGTRSVLNCRAWSVLHDMETRFRLPADAPRILWERMPRGPFETDPERIEYAREWQRRLQVDPADIDQTPIDQWIARINEQLANFAAVAPPAGVAFLPIVPLQSREAPVIRPRAARPRRPKQNAGPAVAAELEMSGAPEPVSAATETTETAASEAPLPTPTSAPPTPPQRLAYSAFPTGERPYSNYGPPRAPLPPEAAQRYYPPRHTIVVPLREISGRSGSTLFSAADIAEATGASVHQIETFIAAHQREIGQPAREHRHGQTVGCYSSNQIEPVLIELVGLTAEQIARRLNVDASELAPYLGRGWARANEHGRYNRATWQQLREEFRTAPPENWPLTDIIEGMRESELIALADALGVPTRAYYVPGRGRVPHVGRTGSILLQAQFPRYYGEGTITYSWATDRHRHRYELAAESGLSPQEVDRWMAEHIRGSNDMQWLQVRDDSLRRQNIRVLPHYSPLIRQRFLEYARHRTGAAS